MMRLDRYLAEAGFGTRKEVKKLIRDGGVLVNGQTVTKAEYKVDETADTVIADGFEVAWSRYAYIMLNKPQGVISATEGAEKTVMDLIYEPYRDMFPCGRLDKDTEGLLLITNDGDLAHRLLSPKNRIEKEYEVRLRDPVSEEDCRILAEGITTGDEAFRPAVITEADGTYCHITITEGKFHEIKRMFAYLGNEVVYLKRLRMKGLRLDESLQPGEYRMLTEEEINDLREAGSSRNQEE